MGKLEAKDPEITVSERAGFKKWRYGSKIFFFMRNKDSVLFSKTIDYQPFRRLGP